MIGLEVWISLIYFFFFPIKHQILRRYFKPFHGTSPSLFFVVLRNSMKRFSGAQLLSKTSEKTVFSGWLTKVRDTVVD